MNQTITATSEHARAATLDIALADDEEDANIFAKLLKQHIEGLVAGDPSKVAVAEKYGAS
jgi:hypothetical protein